MKDEIKNLTTFDILERYVDCATHVAEAAMMLVTAINDRGHWLKAPKIGAVYVTLDGSTVYIARKVGKCRCPVCTGGLNIFKFMSGAFFGSSVDPEKTGEGQEHVEAKEPDQYEVVILRGGHGIDELVGAGPGAVYRVGADGLPSDMQPFDPETAKGLTKRFLAMAGLSLRSSIELTIKAAT